MEKRSCRKPGTVISSVRMQPPATALRSSTQTRLPLRVSMAAQTSELMPLPTMMMSKESMPKSSDFVLPSPARSAQGGVGGGGNLQFVEERRKAPTPSPPPLASLAGGGSAPSRG